MTCVIRKASQSIYKDIDSFFLYAQIIYVRTSILNYPCVSFVIEPKNKIKSLSYKIWHFRHEFLLMDLMDIYVIICNLNQLGEISVFLLDTNAQEDFCMSHYTVFFFFSLLLDDEQKIWGHETTIHVWLTTSKLV